jgi:hypothetical protein
MHLMGRSPASGPPIDINQQKTRRQVNDPVAQGTVPDMLLVTGIMAAGKSAVAQGLADACPEASICAAARFAG